ncbi:uncharacterized protein BDZ83DRAFT_653669 [Colletotrichum acutatum]|uniref:Uncharacterized protein n=1 Tax=Glomerella acutata TaxID=27357 RepID=A0AAD8UF01_GLOAC|nr:uncharacterized protein BDZ83DRAFT_653669 [Colletotrichum acutatum]KAK1722706.1 hypothetical protein BDZ83DRAFT_653669 [Colletotrichum acutatum]
MSNVFPHFPRLPGEIRDLVWKNAVRPHGYRGVHYFSVAEISIVPLFTETEIFKQNTLVERASKGQKQLLTEAFGPPAESPAQLCTVGVIPPEELLRVPVKQLATFEISDGKSDQWFSVFSESDLFVLQSICCIPDFIRLGQELPFLSKEDDLVGVRHVAIGFESTWTVEELLRQQLSFMELSENRFDEYDSLVHASRSLSGCRNSKLWLIDSRLRRKQSVSEENGCKFWAMPHYASRYFLGDDMDDNIAAEVSRFVVALAIVARHQDAVRRNVPEDDRYSDGLRNAVRE